VTTAQPADADIAYLAEQVEGALERAGRRGMSPAAAARRVRHTRRVGCTAADARLALAWLTGQQYAHTGIRDHPDQYFQGQPRWTRKETP
jgi:hypothetical protein